LATTAACTAVDPSGNHAGCGFLISVRDTLPPVLTPKLDATGFSLTLWPPDHTYRTVSLSDCIQSVADRCEGPLPVKGTILRVTSDEPENGRGDGDTCDDIVIANDTTVQLRAQRSARGDGRVYSIFAEVSDDDGNRAPLICKVQVPRHRGKAPAIDSGAAYCVGQGCGAVPGHDRSCGRGDDDQDQGLRDTFHGRDTSL
jgi:hypothetical protein